MTKEEKLAWLRNAEGYELVSHYRALAMEAMEVEIGDRYFEILEDIQLTEQVMTERLDRK